MVLQWRHNQLSSSHSLSYFVRCGMYTHKCAACTDGPFRSGRMWIKYIDLKLWMSLDVPSFLKLIVGEVLFDKCSCALRFALQLTKDSFNRG